MFENGAPWLNVLVLLFLDNEDLIMLIISKHLLWINPLFVTFSNAFVMDR